MMRRLVGLAAVVSLSAVIGCAADGADDDVDDATYDLGATTEVGIVSDLDDTLIPKANPELSKPAQPGIAVLYDILEHRKNGRDGDVYYVTARDEDRVKEVPKYLEENGVPLGPIETGVGGQPWVARPEKVKDTESIFRKTGSQKFVLFGDTSHVDPEVQRDVIAKHPERVIAGIILKTTNTVKPERVEGLYLVNDYAEAAAVLRELGVINRTEEKKVARAARPE